MPLPILLAALGAVGSKLAPIAVTKLFFDTIEDGPSAIAKAALLSTIPGNELLDVGEVIHDLTCGSSSSPSGDHEFTQSYSSMNSSSIGYTREYSTSGYSSGSRASFSSGGRGSFSSGGRR